jgi:hypothetical protein
MHSVLLNTLASEKSNFFQFLSPLLNFQPMREPSDRHLRPAFPRQFRQKHGL